MKCLKIKGRFYYRTLLLFILFACSNFLGFIFVWDKYEGGLEGLNTENPFEDEVDLSYWFWNWIEIKSSDGRTLLRLHYLLGFPTPITGESLEVSLYFKIEPVVYNFYINKEDFFDYVETSLYEITASSGNESLTYNTKYISERYALTNEIRSFTNLVYIPSNWYTSELQFINIRFGNFKVVKGSKQFDASMQGGQTQIIIQFNKLDFDQVESHTEGPDKRWFYTEFSLILDIVPVFKVLFTIIIALGAIATGLIFSAKWFDMSHSDADLKGADKKTDNTLKLFAKLCRIRYIFYSIGSLNFITAVLMFFISSIWFGASTGKYYTIITGAAAITAFIGFLFLVGLVNAKRSSILTDKNNDSNIAEKLKNLHEMYEIKFKEITTTLGVIITLFLFIIGSSAVTKLWF